MGTQGAGVGQVLGDTYRLERVIGQGGMGTIYEASHLRLERRFAVKILIPDVAADAVAYARFQREARVTSGIGHPHIVEVSDFNVTPGGDPYLVMELLEGESLADRLKRRVLLELDEVASITRQVTSALHAAHLKNVVHRDLKPENVFLCRRAARDDYVKLLDFGISKVLGGASGLTRAHFLLGSPCYMSPEQADERGSEADPRSDVYAVGTLMFEMVTGELPFRGANVMSLLYKIVNDAPPRPSSLRPEIPESIERIVLRAMAKDPTERHGSMAELWQDLDAAFQRESVTFTERTEVRHTAWGEAIDIDEATVPVARRPELDPALAGSVEEETVPVSTRPHLAADSEDGQATLSRGREMAVTQHSRRSRRSQLKFAALAVALLVASVTILLLLPDRRPAGSGASSPDAHPVRTVPDARLAVPTTRDAPPVAPDGGPPVEAGRPVKRARLGTLVVASGGIWAEIYLDGKHMGATPQTLQVPPGVHTIEVRRDDLKLRRRTTVTVRPGRRQPIALPLDR